MLPLLLLCDAHVLSARQAAIAPGAARRCVTCLLSHTVDELEALTDTLAERRYFSSTKWKGCQLHEVSVGSDDVGDPVLFLPGCAHPFSPGCPTPLAQRGPRPSTILCHHHSTNLCNMRSPHGAQSAWGRFTTTATWAWSVRSSAADAALQWTSWGRDAPCSHRRCEGPTATCWSSPSCASLSTSGRSS